MLNIGDTITILYAKPGDDDKRHTGVVVELSPESVLIERADGSYRRFRYDRSISLELVEPNNES